MNPTCIVFVVVVVTVGFTFRPCSAAQTTVAPPRFEIPPHLQLNKQTLKNIEVVSSHGRVDSEEGGDELGGASTLQLGLRLLYLSLLFLPVLLTSGLAAVSHLFRTHVWFWLLSQSIALSGAAFIKWGQWASTRPDMFPSELCSALTSLQANAPEHSWAFTEAQIQAELGKPVDEVFEYFSRKPLASGSIAQVYRARLNGRDVAVKVRHPHVREHIELDFILMKGLARLVESLPGLGWLSLSDSLAQFSVTIASQVFLDAEGRHLHLLNQNFRGDRRVGFPKPIAMTPSVLVETFEEGESVAKYIDRVTAFRASSPPSSSSSSSPSSSSSAAAAEPGLLSSSSSPSADETASLCHFIVTSGEDAYLQMLLKDNLMHADLHPGNILVRSGYPSLSSSPSHSSVDAGGGAGAGSGQQGQMEQQGQINAPLPRHQHRITLVDAGMVARLTKAEQRNFIGLLTSMGDGDGVSAASFLLRFSQTGQHSPEARTAFSAAIKELFGRVCRGYGKKTDIGEVLRGVLSLCRDHKVSIDANYATLVMNALCLDGMAKALMPAYNVLDGARALLTINKFVSRVPVPLLRRALLPIAAFLKKMGDAKFRRADRQVL